MFQFFKNLMKASEEARLTEGEDLQSIRQLDRRLGDTLERRARGEIGPHGRTPCPRSPAAQATKAWRSAAYSREAYRNTE
jgi:hypothetical protein